MSSRYSSIVLLTCAMACRLVVSALRISALRYVCTNMTIAHTSTHTATAAIASTMMRFMLIRFFFIAPSPHALPPSAASAPETCRSIS